MIFSLVETSALSFTPSADVGTLGCVTGRASGPQKPVPLIPKGSSPEQEEEKNWGETGWHRFIWKTPLKRMWWMYSITSASSCVGFDAVYWLCEFLVNQQLLLVHISLQLLPHAMHINLTLQYFHLQRRYYFRSEINTMCYSVRLHSVGSANKHIKTAVHTASYLTFYVREQHVHDSHGCAVQILFVYECQSCFRFSVLFKRLLFPDNFRFGLDPKKQNL